MFAAIKAAVLHVLAALYGALAIALFLVFGSAAFIVVMLPIGIAARRYVAHAAAWAYFWSVGMRIRVHDAHHLPDGPCVIVANHASYLDGPVLKAALPARFSFVIKKEVSRIPFAGLLLRRIGSEFVDRFNRHAGGLDARRLLKAADSGQALAFFPEGTFLPQPGIAKFHTGAFAIAARAGMPVVPIGIRGTRRILPGGKVLPRPGAIDIQILPPLGPFPDLDASHVVAVTREQSRERILAATGEPDLAADGLAILHARRS